MVIVERTPYQSIEVQTDTEEVVTISKGHKIRFITEGDGELKEGNVVSFKGTKVDNVEIEMIPTGKEHKETWAVKSMVEGSLKLVNEDQEETNDDEDEEEE